MDVKPRGQITSKVARILSRYYDEKVYGVLFDHSSKSDSAGKISAWMGLETEIKKGTGLSQIDIAVYEKSTNNVFALIEIEETSITPKTLLGDVFATLLGKRFTFPGKLQLNVGDWTTLIVFGKSNGSENDVMRIGFLADHVNEFCSAQAEGIMSVGKVVIGFFNNGPDLEQKLKDQIDLAGKRAKK
jgi:hypothetical protein